jgi:hypothetical protein
MPERLSKETLNSWFYPAMRGEMPGLPLVATPHAVQKRNELRKNWLMKHPRTPNEIPMVSLSPGENNGRKGFFVKTEIVYKPQ